MINKLSLMTGIDIPIPECQLIIHQPSIKEISYIGEEKYFVGAQTLIVDKNRLLQDETVLSNQNNFQIFMAIMMEKELIEKKEAVLDVLQLLFPKYKIAFSPRSMIFSQEESVIMVDESNFECLQFYIKEVCCLGNTSSQQIQYNPANAKAKEIADKLMKGRQRVAEQKGEKGVSIFSQYLSTLIVGLNSMSLKEALDLTVYQLFDLQERYGLYITWDLDIKSRLAGAKGDKPVENWMKNIH